MKHQYRKKGAKEWISCSKDQYDSMITKPPFRNNFEFREIEELKITPEQLLEQQRDELARTDDELAPCADEKQPKKPRKAKNLD